MSLSSLIVQRAAATMRQVEEALARQVIYGGDLVTNLLEVATIDEAVLAMLLGESMQLTAASPGELPVVDAMRAMVTSDVANQRSIVPMEVRGGRLVLAVTEPLPRDLEEQLASHLGMPIEQRVATAVRVRQAIARLYKLPLDRRLSRLVDRLSELGPPSGPPPPLTGLMAKGASVVPAQPQAAQAHTTPTFGTPVIPLVRRIQHPPASTGVPRTVTQAGLSSADPESVRAAAAAPASSVRVPAPSPAPAYAPPGIIQREVGPSPRAARRRRGPLTPEVAKQEAEEASDRDALLNLFFDFARQFFEYSAFFLVHGDIAEGRDAFGTGAAREKVLGMGIPLDLPSVVSNVRERKTAVSQKVAGDGLEGVLLADLARPRDVEVAFIPLVVRTRAVALLIADCGSGGMDRVALAQVTGFAAEVGKAFERIIVRRKLDGFVAGGAGATTGRVDVAAVSQKRPPTQRITGVSAPPPAHAHIPTQKIPSAPAPAFTQRIPSAPVPEPAPATASASEPLHEPSPSPGRVTMPPAKSIRPSPTTVPPPAANITAVRRISGPPIPREDPPSTPAHGVPVVAVTTQPVEIITQPPPAMPPAPARQGPAPEGEPPDTTLQEPSESVPRRSARLPGVFDEDSWDRKSDPHIPHIPPAPPSSSVAVAAHLPPRPHQPDTPLPAVVVDINEDLMRLVDRFLADDSDEQAEMELLRQGDKAMQALMSRFPGPVTFERARIATMARPPRASDCGPVLRLIARERKVALPFVLERLNDPDTDARGWATHLLCELAYPEAIPRLLLRLRDVDAATRMSAALALAVVGRATPREVRDSILGLAHAVDAKDRVAAMVAMAELRQPAMVPELVRALGDGDETVVAAAHSALVQVTRQDFGTDARPWLRWWDQSSAKHRVEWLIDALTHDVSEIRKGAGEELRTVTKEYFGYSSDLPSRDRERARQRYRDWWITEGKARFAKAAAN